MCLWHCSILQVLWWHPCKVKYLLIFIGHKILWFTHTYCFSVWTSYQKLSIYKRKDMFKVLDREGIKPYQKIFFFILRQVFSFNEFIITCSLIALWINCVHPSSPSGFFLSVLPFWSSQVLSEDENQAAEGENTLLI